MTPLALLVEIATLAALGVATPPPRLVVDPVRPATPLLAQATPAKAPAEPHPATVRETKTKAKKGERAAKAKKGGTPKAASKASAPEASAPAVALTRKVQRFYEKTRDFVAHFEQRYTYKVLGRTTKSSGTVSFKKPGLMRWDYDAPREKHFIVDGDTLWVYTPEDHTVIKRPNFRPESLSSSITFLWGKGDLLAEFDVSLAGEATLELTPKTPQPGFARLRFVVDPKTGRVLESTVIDAQGNENHLVFSDARLDTGLDASRFRFTPPKGVTLQTLGASGLR